MVCVRSCLADEPRGLLVVVGCTSTDAAVMSAIMITGEADLQSVPPGTTKTADGPGLWPGVIVDQHFLKRQRFNRLFSIVLDHPGCMGVGIDEETAFIVSPDGWKIIGASSVMSLEPGGKSGERVVTVHSLADGMEWKPALKK